MPIIQRVFYTMARNFIHCLGIVYNTVIIQIAYDTDIYEDEENEVYQDRGNC